MVARSVEASTAHTLPFASRIPEVSNASMLVSPRTMTRWFMVSGWLTGDDVSAVTGLRMSAAMVLSFLLVIGKGAKGQCWRVDQVARQKGTCRCRRETR